METVIKKYNELTLDELYEILKIRTAVFVVEQNCPYQELDDIDKRAVHFIMKDEAGILAYLRVFEKDENTMQMGRILTTQRKKGYGKLLVQEAIGYCKKSGYPNIYLEAQCYAIGFYEKLGFRVKSKPFDEDGIPHVKMDLEVR